MRVVVIGGSAAGLMCALVLARGGHDVVIVERDDLAPAADVEAAAAAAFRAAAPQVVQPHVVLATFREILRERLPDVYEGILAAGAVEASLVSQMPPGITDRAPRPGDERLTFLFSRRATVDWVLARAAAAEPGVEVRYGTPVTGLVADDGRPPRVRGVQTARGDLDADLVVDASGRRTALDRWLAPLGARRSDVTRAECGLAYYSRQYRVRDAALPGPLTTRTVVGLDEFVAGIWGGDNGSMQLALAPLASDRRFTAARDPAVFDAVLRTVPFCAPWMDLLEPTTALHVMGGLHNTLRRLVVDGEPVALGVHAVGDVVCTTNPTFARGLSLAARTVAALADVVAATPGDLRGQALAMDRVVARDVAPWYADQAVNDAAAAARLRHVVEGTPAPVESPSGRLDFGRLRAAAQTDATAFRALWRVMGMVGRPEEVYEDPALEERVREVLVAHPPVRPPQPTRDELEAALAGAPAARVPVVG
ncbi:NAD(P)/FAD-dependent oxidoreductase [Actinomycetospora sp. TBRC 11914]|uniref:NAD(P)/FAD-dependent oxidoreductase n=1 Tax=Actinomycetospora sp. TBRC 11914 TaxID=2729387 RepID=UPI00145D8AD3|nr:FAD-dependent oxidoreductase [Actinomycetospora sp. TBRC 11914]NMO90512.1 FAD-dependent oxidoreductase [Actinomycetospora sp. TBRC 11914]